VSTSESDSLRCREREKTISPGPQAWAQDRLSQQGRQKKPDDKRRNGSGSGGGPEDRLIQALIEKLPEKGPWRAAERVTWLKMLSMAFQMSYGQEPEIEIKEARQLRRPKYPRRCRHRIDDNARPVHEAGPPRRSQGASRSFHRDSGCCDLMRR
jgi:hypothetical protein